MGVVHALTGPDHMSALITVAVNGRLQAFWLGARWGVGHSAGLVLVTGVMLLLRDSFGVNEGSLLEDVEVVMNWFVGIAMLGLGFWSYYRANQLRRAYLATRRGRGGRQDGWQDRTVLLPGMRLPGTARRCSVGVKSTTLPLAEISSCHASAIELVESTKGVV